MENLIFQTSLFMALCLIVFIYLISRYLKKMGWIEFFSVGKDAGFSFHDIRLLKKGAIINKHEKPSSLFWSIDALDRTLAVIVDKKNKIKGLEERVKEYQELEHLLNKLYEYRKRIEFNRPRHKNGLDSTRSIPIGQLLKLKVPMVGVFESKVIENTKNYLILSYPSGPQVPKEFSWRDRLINIYFWKKEDAGYFFQSSFDSHFFDSKAISLRLFHSESILRNQKRGSLRKKCSIPCQLYPLSKEQFYKEEEFQPEEHGLRAILQDISEDGAAVVIGGRGKKNLCIQLSVPLFDKKAKVKGLVRTVDFDEVKNLSCLHIQFVKPDRESKNLILSFVYDIFRDKTLSFEESLFLEE